MAALCLTDAFFRLCFSLSFGRFLFLFFRTGEELESDSESESPEQELGLLSEESELGSHLLFLRFALSLALPRLEALHFLLTLSLEPLLLDVELLLLLVDLEVDELRDQALFLPLCSCLE